MRIVVSFSDQPTELHAQCRSRSPSVVPLQSEAHASPYTIDPTLVRTGYIPNLGEYASYMILSTYKLLSTRFLVLPRFTLVRFLFTTEPYYYVF